jgi:hypothetical protein
MSPAAPGPPGRFSQGTSRPISCGDRTLRARTNTGVLGASPHSRYSSFRAVPSPLLTAKKCYYYYYYYYNCRGRLGAYQDKRKAEPGCPGVQTHWLEGLVWADVRRFLHEPGEVLERLREQRTGDQQSEDLEARRNSLAKRLTTKQAEKDRYVRLYARGEILDAEELETYLADVAGQVENLKLLISSVEADLARAEEDREVAASTEA